MKPFSKQTEGRAIELLRANKELSHEAEGGRCLFCKSKKSAGECPELRRCVRAIMRAGR